MAISRKRQVFVNEYLKCWNQTEAARRAGYKHPDVMGTRLVKVSEIAEEIDKRIEEKAMSADEVLLRLAEQARGEHAKYATPQGTDIAALIADGKAHLIKKWTKTPDRVTLEFYDAQAALVQIGKYHKLFTDRTEIIGDPLIEIGVQPIDYRSGLTKIAPGSIRDSDAPSASESSGNGASVGKNGAGRRSDA